LDNGRQHVQNFTRPAYRTVSDKAVVEAWDKGVMVWPFLHLPSQQIFHYNTYYKEKGWNTEGSLWLKAETLSPLYI